MMTQYSFPNSDQLIQNSLEWMKSRGWHKLLAKRAEREQSLLEHSLLELDALLSLLPILASEKHYNLTQEEQEILCISVLIHDVGKETTEWQAYISGTGKKVGHIDLDLALSIVPEVCSALNFKIDEKKLHEVIAHCAEFHHNKPGRSDGEIFEVILNNSTDRFLCLANIVKGIDHFCSAPTAADAARTLMNDHSLSNHITVTYHSANFRGVSTALLHSACRGTFQNQGWTPILYFEDSTVYASPAEKTLNIPSKIDIEQSLLAQINQLLHKDVAALMIGSPTGKILPKSELVSFSEARTYLEQASRKISNKSFEAKNNEKRRTTIEKYWKLKDKEERPTDEDVDLTSAFISTAQPEMIVFKVFKELANLALETCSRTDVLNLAENLYEERFGKGSWQRLQSTSTLMPAQDMHNLIDPFWDLSGSSFNSPEVTSIKQLPELTRMSILIQYLDEIIQRLVETFKISSPRNKLAAKITSSVLADLQLPSDSSKWRTHAELQKEHYSISKKNAGKFFNKAIYFCPLCNQSCSDKSAKKASADFVDKPESHTNRATSLGSFQAITICHSCFHERLLVQIICGQRPEEVIYLSPQLNLGPRHGEYIVKRVKEWVAAAQLQLNGDGDPSRSFHLSFLQTPAKITHGKDPALMDDQELLSLFMNRISPEKTKEKLTKAVKLLKEEFDDDISELNSRSGYEFKSWEEAGEATIQNSVESQELANIRKEVNRSSGLYIICETPNFVMIPLAKEISAKDEAVSSKGLRKLFVALTLGLAFQARIAIRKNGEPFRTESRTGLVYVEPLPAIRSLIGSEWISVATANKWLHAIGAASLLTRDTNFPERNALYTILAANPAEWLVRRIEQISDNGIKRKVTLGQINLIEQLPNFSSKA